MTSSRKISQPPGSALLDPKSQPALFSLEESESHYLVALDIPTIPAEETEILSRKNELVVEGISARDQLRAKQIFFRCRPKGKGIKASYKDGILWLLLPKSGLSTLPQPAEKFKLRGSYERMDHRRRSIRG